MGDTINATNEPNPTLSDAGNSGEAERTNTSTTGTGNDESRTGFLRGLIGYSRLIDEPSGTDNTVTIGYESPTGTEQPAKRKPGRPRKYPIGDTSQPVTTNTNGTGGYSDNSERGTTGNSGTTSTSDNNGTIGNAGTRSSVGAEVEPPLVKPKRQYTRRKKTHGITSDNVESAMVRLFGVAASVRGEHWKIKDVKNEVEPWSNDAATVANNMLDRMDETAAAKVAALSAGVSVALGVGMMIGSRVWLDMQLAKAAKSEPKPDIPRPDEFINQSTESTNGYSDIPQTPTKPRTPSAASVHPKGSVIGINTNRGGL